MNYEKQNILVYFCFKHKNNAKYYVTTAINWLQNCLQTFFPEIFLNLNVDRRENGEKTDQDRKIFLFFRIKH